MRNFRYDSSYIKDTLTEKLTTIPYVNTSYSSTLDSTSLKSNQKCSSINKCNENFLVPNAVLLEIYNNSLIIENNNVIPFNIEKINTDKKNLIFHLCNNTLTLLQPGLYIFDWWIGIEGSNSFKQLKIDIETTNSCGKKNLFPTTLPVIITGLFYGQGLIQTNEAIRVRLVNSSDASISLSNYTEMQGSLKIIAFYN